MSKKIAVLSAIMLVFGGVSIPGGFIINNVIDGMVTDRTDEGLLGIEEQFVPIAEDMILDIGPAIALQMIKEMAVPASIPLVEASFLTQLLYNAYGIGEDRQEDLGGDCLLNMFFTQANVDLGWTQGGETSFSIQLKDAGIPYYYGDSDKYVYGLAEWYENKTGTDLGIGSYELIAATLPSPDPNDLLVWGQETPIYPESAHNEVNDPPGFIQDTEFGFGILDFCENYEIVEANGTQEAKDNFCNPYEEGEEITFEQMGAVYDYYNDYWVPEVIPILIEELQNETSMFSQNAPQYINMNLEEIAYLSFLQQWVNFTTYWSGTDFHEFADDIPQATYGLEVDSTISVKSAYKLWNETDEWSFLNMTGIEKWLAANTNSEDKTELELHFDLTSQECQDILDWLWNGPDSFSQGVLPLLLESELGYNMSLIEFAKLVMLEQWANGTIMGMTMFEGGIDFSEFIPSLPEGSTGFEVGVPVPTNMSIESALLLWDLSNPYSLVKDISVWWSITSKDSENYAKVRDANKLDDKTMDMILDWLPDFRNNLMPALAQYEMGLPMDTTQLGSTIQIGGIAIGGIAIALASTGLVSNRVVSNKKKAAFKANKPTPSSKK